MYMPEPAVSHAIMAPKGPVASPKIRGNEKIPAPTMEPTTMPVSAKRDSFWDASVGAAVSRGTSAAPVISADGGRLDDFCTSHLWAHVRAESVTDRVTCP